MIATTRLFTTLCLLIAVMTGCAAQDTLPAEQRATMTEHWIYAGDIEIRASLYMPDGAEESVPAAVLIHGSGPTGRGDMLFYLRSTLEMGLAAVVYDKRGVGETGGTYWAFNVMDSDERIRELSADASAVHAWLAAQPGIDPDRVGYIGGSQAGWVMPQAAADTGATAFIIIGAGTPLAAGPEAAHEQTILAGGTMADADQAIEVYEGPMGYDPAGALAAIDVPTLWIFGTADWVIPTTPSIARINAYRAEGHDNLELLVIPEMDHNFQVHTGDDVQQYWVHQLAADWLRGLGVTD